MTKIVRGVRIQLRLRRQLQELRGEELADRPEIEPVVPLHEERVRRGAGTLVEDRHVPDERRERRIIGTSVIGCVVMFAVGLVAALLGGITGR